MAPERQGEVVVMVRLTTRQPTDDAPFYAVRIPEMGLTGYGDSEDEATQRVKKMFASMVDDHREKGTLENMLDASGLEWCWRHDYRGRLPVEQVGAGSQPTKPVDSRGRPSAQSEPKLGLAA